MLRFMETCNNDEIRRHALMRGYRSLAYGSAAVGNQWMGVEQTNHRPYICKRLQANTLTQGGILNIQSLPVQR